MVRCVLRCSDGVIIAKVDADSEKELGSRFGVTGFPTIKFFPKGSLEPEEFEGDRSAAGIVKCVHEILPRVGWLSEGSPLRQPEHGKAFRGGRGVGPLCA